MSQCVFCPQCQASYAYSPAIRGRSYKCTQCGESFAVATPLDDTDRLSPSSATAALATMPPPLPAASTWRSGRSVGRLPRRGTASAGQAGGRRSGLAASVGLTAILLVGFAVIASGIGYMLWPSTSAPTPTELQTAAPPIEPATDVEKPKSLQEILKDRPDGGGGKDHPLPGVELQPPVQPIPPRGKFRPM